MKAESQSQKQVRDLAWGRSDEQLLEDCLAGDRDAFESLVRRHQRALVNHIYRHTGRREGAVDLAQEVLLKVYLSLSSFDPRYRFTTWLYRIASNCAIDNLRKKRPQVCSLHPDSEDGQGPTHRLAHLAHGIENLLMAGETSMR